MTARTKEENSLNIYGTPHTQGLRALCCAGVEHSSDGGFRSYTTSCKITSPLQRARMVPSPTGGRLGWGLTRRAKILPLQVGQFQLSVRKQATSPLQGGGRSCACFASYKCGEGVHPVRETYNHPVLDSVSIQYGQTGINRFRVERRMSGVKTLSVVSRRHLSVGEIEYNLTTPFIPLPKGDNQELGGVAC